MKILMFASMAVVLTACGSEAMKTEVSQNGTEAALIAEVDGCRLWRVKDGSARHVYFANCNGQASVEWRTSNGKSSQSHQSLTNGVPNQ